ncbi:hypothetical protein FE257_009433 [Aspergillus nanangensis]|uniref:Uncharacterized protein n=1 Tax=Aspergillus nanangensis TaxID=2582783 RepID=A0AAD4CK36_ASPNN|nr:hypothetical protein FE257_009433 [Aspergillus nanangensis]
MSRKIPHAAFCEEYDEDSHVIRPHTRQVANVAARRSRTDLRSVLEPLVDVGSDSGYSSRTAATVHSTQSAPSGRKSPGPLKLRTDLDRVRSIRKERTKDRNPRTPRDDKMQVGAYPSMSHHHQMQPSPSRSQRRESSQVRHPPGNCWECDHGLYHGSAPVEPRAIDYPYYVSQPSTPSIADYPPPSPQTARYPPPSIIQDTQTRPSARAGRSNSYNAPRPISYHGGAPPNMGGGMMYHPGSMTRYDHGPPPSSSAYANAQYAPSSYGQQGPYYGLPDYIPHDTRKERSSSRTRDSGRARRPSTYAQQMPDFDLVSAFDDDDEPLEAPPPPPVQLQPRQRQPSHSSHDEDYYRMPPPPMKHKAAPNIIQKRPQPQKVQTSPVVLSERRGSQSLDLTDLRDALPNYEYRGSSRETVVPERNHSLRSSRRPTTMYHEPPPPPPPSRPARMAVEHFRRRQPTVYDPEPSGDEMEDKHLRAEEYQASRTAKSPAIAVPLTADALYKAKSSARTASDSGSQKTRSASSRGSDARTQSGSGMGGPKPEEDNNFVMTMNGITLSLNQESIGRKTISVQAGETGALSLNIQGKRPKKYLAEGSRFSGSTGRREIEDPRRARGDRRSDRASRRSSRSVYSGGQYEVR